MNSLERRLQVWLAVTLLLLMGLLWIVGNQSIRALTEDFVVSRLEHDAESLLAAIELDPGNTRVRWRRINQIYNQPLSGHYYAILLDNAEPLYSRSLWDHTLDIPRLAPGESRHTRFSGPDGQQLLLLVRGFRKQDRELTLAVAEDMTLIKERRNRFKRDFGLFALVGVLGLLLVQSMVVRRAFKRLQPLREDIRRLERGEAGSLSEDVPNEILPLVREFNNLVQLLAQRLERSRNALGNLTHALKGPLNILMQYFDRLEKGGGPQPEEARAQAGRIGQLMDRELRRARLAGAGLQSRRFIAHEELPDLVGLLRQLYRDKNPDIQWRIAEGIAPFGDREDMLELFGNLLDNACKWAASKVTCRLRDDAGIELIVADDGKGISDDELGRLAERGVRLDETTEGHGLGLAIARDIVNLYGGELTFSRSVELGGLQVTVRLPCPGESNEVQT
jgi:signal transduction histidine kinase